MSDQTDPVISNGPGWVIIGHPSITGTAEVTRESFDAADGYASRGWTIVKEFTDTSVESTAALPPPQPNPRPGAPAPADVPKEA